MAVSGTVSATTFNTLKVIEQAFRRCRMKAQNITAEMMAYAQDALYLLLSELANGKTPSWCIDRVILPMYQNQTIVNLPLGTVSVLNLNYRTIQQVTGTTVYTTNAATTAFSTTTQVATVGLFWTGASVPVTFEVSTNGLSWTAVGSSDATAVAGQTTWTDIDQPLAYLFFRVSAASPLLISQCYMGNMPMEIPLGSLNRDGYVNQSNKIFPGRPSNFWYQRDIPQPVLHLWPAAYEAAENAQLILWRERHIMDVGTLRQDIEVPQRWLEAIVSKLAEKLALETPEVDANLVPVLAQKAMMAEQLARDGDGDGSPTFYQPYIGVYTK